MLRRILISVFAFTLMIPLICVKAETYPLEDPGWQVVFNGKKLESNYDEASINEALQGMEPGDTADLEFTLFNGYKEAVNWWMGNEVLKSFEGKENKANGGSYIYELSYIDPSGEITELYSSKVVGGDTAEGTDPKGLLEATEALDEYFLLGEIEPGMTAKVTLHIELDGETQNNSYQDTLARLKMIFAVEIPTIGKIIVPNTSANGIGIIDDIVSDSHLRGYLIGVLTFFLLTVVFGLLLYINRKDRKAYED